MIYHEIAYQFLLENPNTLFYKLPLEILAFVMQKLNQSKFEWNSTVILYQHYRNLIKKSYQRINILEWKTDWVTHDLPIFIVTMDTEFIDNNSVFVKELSIRKKYSPKINYWNMRSRHLENVCSKDRYYKMSLKQEDGTRKEFWRTKIEPKEK